MNELGGRCQSVARHDKSSYPIHGIWSPIPDACDNQELAGHGDHSIAEAVFSFSRKDRRGTQFRFSHTCRLKEYAVENATAPDWGSTATSTTIWSHTLTMTVDEIWEWGAQVVRPIVEQVNAWYAVLFLTYITLVVFAVIRIVTALFLKDFKGCGLDWVCDVCVCVDTGAE